jgi:hypothetical protein
MFVYSDMQLNGYTEDLEYLNVVLDAAVDSELFIRVSELRTLVPIQYESDAE